MELRVMNEQEQNEFVDKMLNLNPIELAESLLLIYGKELTKGITNPSYAKKSQEILEQCREQLVNIGVQYDKKVGLSMRKIISNPNLKHQELKVF